jgi:glycosyl transferase, family 25
MTASIGLITVYVVSIRTSDARRRSVTEQLARFGLVPEFIDDWDTGDITPEIDAQTFKGDLNIRQKSCGLKHLTALRRIVERNQRQALVLEDDALLADGFADGVKAALSEWPRYPQPSVVFIGCGGNFYTPRSMRKPGRRLYPGSRGRLTDSYVIGVAAAKARLDWVAVHRVSHPIDNQFEIIDRDVGIMMLWLEDPVVEQGSKTGLFDTTIVPDSQWPSWLQALIYRWEKLRRKYLYQLWR